jgi:hypothetical protein
LLSGLLRLYYLTNLDYFLECDLDCLRALTHLNHYNPFTFELLS